MIIQAEDVDPWACSPPPLFFLTVAFFELPFSWSAFFVVAGEMGSADCKNTLGNPLNAN